MRVMDGRGNRPASKSAELTNITSDAVPTARESLSGTYSEIFCGPSHLHFDTPQADTVPTSTQDCFSHDICSFFNNAKGGARWAAIPCEDRNL